jgi:hypothetical protein
MPIFHPHGYKWNLVSTPATVNGKKVSANQVSSQNEKESNGVEPTSHDNKSLDNNPEREMPFKLDVYWLLR